MNFRKRKITLFLTFLTLFLYNNLNLFSQFNYYNITGARKGYIDTLGFERLEKNSKEKILDCIGKVYKNRRTRP